jgi:hypothetical protein
VVLVLSKDFISKSYSMKDLQLLLELQRQGSPAVLLPVFYEMSFDDLGPQADLYKKAAAGQVALLGEQWSKDMKVPSPHQLQQWAEDLDKLRGVITGFQENQVSHWWLDAYLNVPDDQSSLIYFTVCADVLCACLTL